MSTRLTFTEAGDRRDLPAGLHSPVQLVAITQLPPNAWGKRALMFRFRLWAPGNDEHGACAVTFRNLTSSTAGGLYELLLDLNGGELPPDGVVLEELLGRWFAIKQKQTGKAADGSPKCKLSNVDPLPENEWPTEGFEFDRVIGEKAADTTANQQKDDDDPFA